MDENNKTGGGKGVFTGFNIKKQNQIVVSASNSTWRVEGDPATGQSSSRQLAVKLRREGNRRTRKTKTPIWSLFEAWGEIEEGCELMLDQWPRALSGQCWRRRKPPQCCWRSVRKRRSFSVDWQLKERAAERDELKTQVVVPATCFSEIGRETLRWRSPVNEKGGDGGLVAV